MVGYTTEGSCVPECANVADGKNVPNPRNCQQYYTCLNGEPNTIPHTCLDGEHFESQSGLCASGSCPTTPICEPKCNFEPTGEVTNLAHRTECTKYYFHTGIGEPIEMVCPEATPYFDGEACQTDPNRCCEPCMVYCQSAGTTVADSKDCTAFYLCRDDTYFPDETDIFYCPVGEQYDFGAGACGTSACLQLC